MVALTQSKPIGDVTDLAGLAITPNPEILAEVKKYRGRCSVVVTLTLDVYFVRPTSLRGPIALRQLIEFVRKFGPGSEYPITQAVFNSLRDKAPNSTEPINSNAQVDELLDQVITEGATDVHIHIRDKTTIEFRLHGVMVPRSTLSQQQGKAIINVMFSWYAKSRFGGEPALDGQFYFKHQTPGGERRYLIRLSMVETVTGMTCKCRVRDPSHVISLEDAGYSNHQLTVLRGLMAKGQGLLLFTGAMNSGKSSTLTALLKDIPPSYSILEISDTVEVQLPNVSHVELPSDGANLDKRIAAVQKSSVRQDADYLVIGEIRDRITAKNAEVMALQGCIVLSTGHSSDPISFYLRMVSEADFQMSKAAVLSPQFLIGIVSQALVATLCPNCRLSEPPEDSVSISRFHNAAELKRVFSDGLGDCAHKLRFRNVEGCGNCNRTGLVGRTVVAEIMPFDPQVRELLRANQLNKIGTYMRQKNCETKHEHGLRKVLRGQIDPVYLERKIGAIDSTNCALWKHDEQN